VAEFQVLAKDAVKGGSTLVSKVLETDVKETANRLTNKVMEKVEGSNFKLVETLPAVENAILSIKQTDAIYRELVLSLKDSFVSQTRAATRQLKAANRADVIGRDIEDGRHGPGMDSVGRALSGYSSHLVLAAEQSQELTNIKDAAEVEERAQDDFDSRVFETPAAKLISAIEGFLDKELAQAVRARSDYKDLRREVSLNAKKVEDLESKGQSDRLEACKQVVADGMKLLEVKREELMRTFMVAEQRKPTLQMSLHSYLQAQLEYHQQCAISAEKILKSVQTA
jgi:hypothetical protein